MRVRTSYYRMAVGEEVDVDQRGRKGRNSVRGVENRDDSGPRLTFVVSGS